MLSSEFGTDLDAAFGLLTVPEPQATKQNVAPASALPVHQQQQLPMQNNHAPQPPKQAAQHMATAPAAQNAKAGNKGDNVYDANMFNQQFVQEQQVAKLRQQIYAQQGHMVQQKNQEPPSYIDKMMSKKRDVLKIILFAMMILLAISAHTFIEFWLKDFVSGSELSYKQELGLRLVYPLAVLLLLWILKTWSSSR